MRFAFFFEVAEQSEKASPSPTPRVELQTTLKYRG